MTVTILLENSVSDNTNLKLKCAHGLSLHIDSGGRRTLLDAGPNNRFAANARTMGIDLSRVDQMVLSHAHSDHGGGLREFAAVNQTADIFIHRAGTGRYYADVFNFLPVSIGLNRRTLKSIEPRIRYFHDDVEIDNRFSILTTYPDTFPRPESNAVLKEKSGRKRIPDRFLHEVLLMAEEPDGFVVFTGCSHSGITNMVDRAESEIRKSGSDKGIKAVFGGFHLYNPLGNRTESQDYLERLASAMNAYDTVFYTGHCTGSGPFGFLHQRLGNKVRPMNTGDVVTV